jgi:hypothetical protein
MSHGSDCWLFSLSILALPLEVLLLCCLNLVANLRVFPSPQGTNGANYLVPGDACPTVGSSFGQDVSLHYEALGVRLV